MKAVSLGLGLTLAAVLLAVAVLPHPAARAVTDTTPPTGTIVINGNRSATNNRTVTIAMTWADTGGSGVGRMRFSDNGSTWSAYESLTPSKSYTLPAGADGHRTIRVQFIDKANNRSATCSDYILLDRTAPTGGISINNGAPTTASRSVTLNLNWADAGAGVSRMRFSDNGSTWTSWEPQKATKAHTLPAENGNRTVRVQFLDGAGNYSPVYNDYIRLQMAAGTTETVLLPQDEPLEMVWVPGGSFTMGSPSTEPDRQEEEGPQHTVTLDGFWMAKYELTKRQWTAVMNTTPWVGYYSVISDPDSPAVRISWDDAHSFIAAVNTHTGKTFRLPSEAQWEYACRANTTERFYWGANSDGTAIADYAWYWGNCAEALLQYGHVVGQKLPNAFGLYDMVGNVGEWCEDDFHSRYTDAPTDGQAWVDSPRSGFVVMRGGAFFQEPGYCRSAYRTYNLPATASSDIGIRLCR